MHKTATPPPEDLGLGHSPGASHYRAYVGPPADFDLVAAMVFNLLTTLGLRQQHRVLDIGCGSLRVGRLLIPYLNRDRYVGIEPNRWLVEEGIRSETGQDLVDIKQPRFVFADDAGELIDAGDKFDYVVAQSIFSHCGLDLIDAWLGQASRLLAPDGAVLATFWSGTDDSDAQGWIYPDCVAYRPATIVEVAARNGLRVVFPDFRHPRQTWAVLAHPDANVLELAAGELSWNATFERTIARQQA
jgi:cyclopropane fatty-acyl-phospholipid synthase-like methyltransferase